MEILCDSCNETYTVNNKRNGRDTTAHNKVTKMSQCPNCGSQNFYNIVQKYINDKRIEPKHEPFNY